MTLKSTLKPNFKLGGMVEFDLDGKTAGDLTEIYPAAKKRDMNAIAEVLAQFVKRCPPEWGNPKNKATYLKGNYFEITKPVWEALSEELVADYDLPAGVEVAFDTLSISAELMGEIWTAAPLDYAKQAVVLCQVVAGVEGLGGKSFDVKSEADYLGLGYREFRAVWHAFVAEVNSKN